MELKTKAGLLNLWIFIMLLVLPYRPTQGCNVTFLVQYIRSTMRGLLETYLEINGNGINRWPHPIKELEINSSDSIEKKIQKVHCGFFYVHKALKLIDGHQRRIHHKKKDIFDKLQKMNSNLENTMACVSGGFHMQCQNQTEPDFPFFDTYSQKQWGQSLLETFLLFLDDAVDVVKHGDKLKHKLKHA